MVFTEQGGNSAKEMHGVLHKGITFLSKYKVTALDMGRSDVSIHLKIWPIFIAFIFSHF